MSASSASLAMGHVAREGHQVAAREPHRGVERPHLHGAGGHDEVLAYPGGVGVGPVLILWLAGTAAG